MEEIKYKLIRAVRGGNLTEVETVVNSYGLSYYEAWSGGYILLHDAIKSGRVEIAKFLLQKGAKVNSKAKDVDTPLHFAAACRDLELVQMLINHNAAVNATNSLGETPLHVAVREGHEDVVHLLCRSGAFIQTDNSGLDPLGHACGKGLLETVKHFLTYYSSSFSINTALLIASQKNDDQIVRYLLEAHADPNVRGRCFLGPNFKNLGTTATTPLLEACQKGNLNIVELLLRNGAGTDCSRPGDNYKPLHIACEKDHFKIVEALLSRGADVNSKADNDITPIFFAAKRACLPIIQLLIKHRCDINCSSSKGNFSPLHTASIMGRAEIVAELLSNGANLEAKTAEGLTALHVAAHEGFFEIVAQLLNNCAKVDVQTSEGSTPLHLAVKNGHKNVAKYLLESGADVNLKDKQGDDPLYFAVKRKNELSLVNLILNHKPNVSFKVIDLAADFVGSYEWIINLIAYSLTVNPDIGLYVKVLTAAVSTGQAKIVEVLLSKGIHPNDERFSSTLVHEAVKRGHLSVLKILLEAGWDVSASDEAGHTPLHFSLDSYRIPYYSTDNEKKEVCVKIVQMLLDKGADIKTAPHLLLEAISMKSIELCRLLIESGSDLNLKCRSGETALLQAVTDRDCAEEIVRLLIESGADINMCNKNGETPLGIAIRQDRERIVDVLLKTKADVKVRENDGKTLLHLAASAGSERTVHLLIRDFDLNLDAVETSNKTALHLATAGQTNKIVEILLNNFADVNIEDDSGSTALDCAFSEQKLMHGVPDELYNECIGLRVSIKIVKILMEHPIKLKVAGFHISGKTQGLLKEKSNKELHCFEEQCKREVCIMKGHKLTEDVSLFDVFQNQQNPLFLKDKSLVKHLDSLKINEGIIHYSSMIFPSLRRSRRRIKYLACGQTAFCNLLKTRNICNQQKLPAIPEEVLEQIVVLLNDNELKSLILCVEQIKHQVSKQEGPSH